MVLAQKFSRIYQQLLKKEKIEVKWLPKVAQVCNMLLILFMLRSSDRAKISLFINFLLSSTFAADFCILNRKSRSWPLASFRAR